MAARMVLATASKPIVTNKYIARGKFGTDFLKANNQLKTPSLSHKLLSSLKICHFFIFSLIFLVVLDIQIALLQKIHLAN